MRITRGQLRRLIREEFSRVIHESFMNGDKVFIPAGTSTIVSNQEELTSVDTTGTVDEFDEDQELVFVRVDNERAMTKIQRQWNAEEGLPRNLMAVHPDDLRPA